MIQAEDVREIMAALRQANISAWLDGGWGVDALVGHQTRAHDDLDLVISLQDAETVMGVLAPLKFRLHEDERPTRFVLTDHQGRGIDFHTVTFDEEGGGIQQLHDGSSYRYPPEGFHGEGSVNDVPMPCLSVEVQVECHLGYQPSENDYHDMHILADHYRVTLPERFQRT
jgi:lincosamide nucleotidyltransferase A/C/D/E